MGVKPQRSPGWLLEPGSNARPRGMAARADPVRARVDTVGMTKPGLQAPWHHADTKPPPLQGRGLGAGESHMRIVVLQRL